MHPATAWQNSSGAGVDVYEGGRRQHPSLFSRYPTLEKVTRPLLHIALAQTARTGIALRGPIFPHQHIRPRVRNVQPQRLDLLGRILERLP